MSRSVQTNMVVAKSRMFGGKNEKTIDIVNKRLPYRSRTIENIIDKPWLELDFGNYGDLYDKYRHLGGHVCIASARVNSDVLDLMEAAGGDPLMRMSLNTDSLTFDFKPRLQWFYQGKAHFWIPEYHEQIEPEPDSTLALGRRAVLTSAHIMPIRHETGYSRPVEPELVVYAR